MLKQQILEDLKKTVKDLGYPVTDIVLSITQNPNFGDYSTNLALQLAKLESAKVKQSPTEIAKEILEQFGKSDYLERVEVAGGGFINFFAKPEMIAGQVKEILAAGKKFGENNLGEGQKIEVEFISANPTGPLTLASGRGGAIGDTLANVLEKSGYKVDREYYVNDTGNQIRLLGESVLAQIGKLSHKDEHYKGEYISELAEKFQDQLSEDPQDLGHKLAEYLLDYEIKPAILRLRIRFDEFYSEKSVYERDLISKTVELLKDKGVAYEKEGALWFKASEFGDEKDRVLMTSMAGRGRSEPTYFLADIAHHLDTLERGYVKRINILGADHHGYGARMKGVMEVLGYGQKIEIIFMQFVRLFKAGKEMRMSKRAGSFVTLDELLDAVGKDVVRFFFLMYSPDSLIDFNLDLAKERSEKNPVFYVQYAHARMHNIFQRAQKAGDEPGNDNDIDYKLLKSKHELVLIKHLASFPEVILEIASTYQVQRLTVYATTLADLFHKFYEQCPVLQAENENLKRARLALVQVSKITLNNTLYLLGISAPERM